MPSKMRLSSSGAPITGISPKLVAPVSGGNCRSLRWDASATTSRRRLHSPYASYTWPSPLSIIRWTTTPRRPAVRACNTSSASERKIWFLRFMEQPGIDP